MPFIPHSTHIFYPLVTIFYKWVYLMGNLMLHNIWVLSTTKRGCTHITIFKGTQNLPFSTFTNQ